jgi:hypothetical protein
MDTIQEDYPVNKHMDEDVKLRQVNRTADKEPLPLLRTFNLLVGKFVNGLLKTLIITG